MTEYERLKAQKDAILAKEALAAARWSPGNWRREPPDRPGWWWCRNTTDKPGEVWEGVVRIDKLTGLRELTCSWMTSPGCASILIQSDWSPATLWAGPLEHPSPPVNPETSD